ncbi:MAG: putative Tic20 family protein [Flavobacteriales bacterium]|jgi:uncharacterized Tic20 family protein
MDTTITTHQKNVSTFIHLSTFSKWFFPFGNFIAPLILWSAQKRKSPFIDTNGRNAINFQLSILLYMIAIAVISIPFIIYQAFKVERTNANFSFENHFHTNGDIESLSTLFIVMIVVGTLLVGLALFEIINVVSAALKASNGESYRYPLSINFISESTITEETQEPSETTEETETVNIPTDEGSSES